MSRKISWCAAATTLVWATLIASAEEPVLRIARQGSMEAGGKTIARRNLIWSAVIVQVPTVTIDTVAPLIVHTDVVVEPKMIAIPDGGAVGLVLVALTMNGVLYCALEGATKAIF